MNDGRRTKIKVVEVLAVLLDVVGRVILCCLSLVHSVGVGMGIVVLDGYIC